MGAKPSKGGHSVPGKVAMGPQISLPPQPPYEGYPIHYQYVTTDASMSITQHLSFSQPITLEASNMESHYPHLAAMYAQGYKMLLFAVLPGSSQQGGLTSLGRSSVNIKFMGIFRALFPEEQGEQWDLRIARSHLVNQMFSTWSGSLFLNSTHHSGSATNNYHIVQTIDSISQSGGRLVSVELTGMSEQELVAYRSRFEHRHTGFGMGSLPALQLSVDVFFEVPRQPSNERYIYQIVMCPMVSTYQFTTGAFGKFVSVLDWQSVMGQYLGSGWRLVDIFEDHSVSTMSSMRTHSFGSNMVLQKNCLFIFEKPSSRLQDNTPLYEGTMVEHLMTTNVNTHAMGLGGISTAVQTNWEPVINHMGQYGWQVIRILDTPDQIIQGMFNPTVNTRQMIFFQRKKVGSGLSMSPQGGAPPGYFQPPDGAPPTYEQASGGKM